MCSYADFVNYHANFFGGPEDIGVEFDRYLMRELGSSISRLWG